MLKHGAESALALGGLAPAGLEEIEVAFNFGGDLRAGYRARPAGRHFEPQRDAFHQAADLHDGGPVGQAGLEAPRPGGAFEKELDGGGLVGGVEGLREGQPADLQHRFGA